MKNKAQRIQIERNKWYKRLKVLGLTQTDEQKYFCFKAQAKPCSCYACSHLKFKRKSKLPYRVVNEIIEGLEEIERHEKGEIELQDGYEFIKELKNKT